MSDLTLELLRVVEEAGEAVSVQGRLRGYFGALEGVLALSGVFATLFDWDQFKPPEGSTRITLEDPVAAIPPLQHIYQVGYDAELMTLYAEKYVEHDCSPARSQQELGRVLREDELFAEEEWETNPFLTDFFVPRMGFRYAMTSALEITGERLLAWAVYRRPDEAPFSAEEREACQALNPHLGRLVYDAFVAEAAAGCLPPVDRPRCTLRLDEDGRVEVPVSGGEAFWDWVRERRTGERDRVRVDPGGAGRDPGVVALERLGDRSWIRLEVARGPGGKPLALIDLLPGGSREYVQAEGAHLGLTQRELEVAVLALRGRSNKEIAAELSTSAQTVKHQLTAVYAKAGADGRGELARLLMGPADGPPSP